MSDILIEMEPTPTEPRRSIQDIIPPARSRPIRVSPSDRQIPPNPPGPLRETNESGKWYVYGFILVALLVIGGGGVAALSTIFHRAYVTVVPYTFTVPVSGSFNAAVDSSVLPYQKVSIEEVASRTIPATGSTRVEERSSGTIVVYNAYSTQPQRLITNTRFESPEGSIYRVHNPISIPGYTTKAGLKVPGSIEVTVYADEPGERSNIGLSDFTIPGLKNSSEQYKLIYAKSKEALSGGFVGERAIVDPALRASTVSELQADLNRSLRSKIADSAPEGHVLFDSTIAITFSDNPDQIDNGNAVVSVTGTAVAPALHEASLAREFARSANVSYDGDLRFDNPNDFAVIIDPGGAPTVGDPFSISASGTALLVAAFDEGRLLSDLAGKAKKDITDVRINYPGIKSMSVKVYPLWRGTVPDTLKKLNIEVIQELDNGVDAAN